MTRGSTSLGTKELDTAALQRAFKEALANRPKALDDLLTRYGGLPGPMNTKLADAFSDEVVAHKGDVAPLLARLANDGADADQQRVFLPIAAAYGFCACLSSNKLQRSADIETAWLAIAQLAVDGRLPVRLGMVGALVGMSTQSGGAAALMERAMHWLEDDDRETRFGAAATVLAVLSNTNVLTAMRDHEAVLEYVSRVIALIADAPRSAERSEARRRALRVLPETLMALVARMARVAGERGAAWLAQECEHASQPQVREVLSDVIVRLQKDSQGLGRATTERLRKTLEASAAPLRDGVVKRPGTGRGRSSRKIR
jgi:hypothetical protein